MDFFFPPAFKCFVWKLGRKRKITEGVKEKTEGKTWIYKSYAIWRSSFIFRGFSGAFFPTFRGKNLLVRFETEFSLFIYLESFLYCVRNNSSQIIPWELQILWITGNYLFLVVPTGRWVSEYSTAVTVPIVFLLQRQKSKGVFAVGGIVTDLVWESSKLIYTITIWSYDNGFFLRYWASPLSFCPAVIR